MTVYVVESGEYEQRGVDLVAASVESAVAALKVRYPDTTEWGELVDTSWNIVGSSTFERRERWTIEGKYMVRGGYLQCDEYDITAYELLGGIE